MYVSELIVLGALALLAFRLAWQFRQHHNGKVAFWILIWGAFILIAIAAIVVRIQAVT